MESDSGLNQGLADLDGSAGKELRRALVSLEIAKENGDWYEVALLYHRAGEMELRDKYIDLTLAEDPSPFYQVLLRRMQGKASELPDEIKAAAVEQASQDWTVKAGVLYETGDVKEATRTLLSGITEALERSNPFAAAYYIKNRLSAIVKDLFMQSLDQFAAEGDLWWQLRCYEELGWDGSAQELLLGNEAEIRASNDVLLLQKLAAVKGNEEEYVDIMKAIGTGKSRAYTSIARNQRFHRADPI